MSRDAETLKYLQDLKDAEDFFEFFKIDYDKNIINTYRLHILKRFGSYIAKIDKIEPSDIIEEYKKALLKAYNDFLEEDKESKKFYHLKKEGKEFIPINKLIKF